MLLGSLHLHPPAGPRSPIPRPPPAGLPAAPLSRLGRWRWRVWQLWKSRPGARGGGVGARARGCVSRGSCPPSLPRHGDSAARRSRGCPWSGGDIGVPLPGAPRGVRCRDAVTRGLCPGVLVPAGRAGCLSPRGAAGGRWGAAPRPGCSPQGDGLLAWRSRARCSLGGGCLRVQQLEPVLPVPAGSGVRRVGWPGRRAAAGDGEPGEAPARHGAQRQLRLCCRFALRGGCRFQLVSASLRSRRVSAQEPSASAGVPSRSRSSGPRSAASSEKRRRAFPLQIGFFFFL